MSKSLFALALILPMCMACTDGLAQPRVPDSPPIIPAPLTTTHAEGAFSVTKDTRVSFAGPAAEHAARYFTALLERTRGLVLAAGPESAGGAAAIHFALTAEDDADDEEGYSLAISPERIGVTSSGPRGLFYGGVSLWQLLTANAAHEARITVQSMTIADEPRFRWRGLMLDSARHFQSPDFVKRFIDVMALHKLNVLHWHLTDDQAWRLSIDRYPKLTEVGAWRVPAGPAAAGDIDPQTQRPRLYGGSYSKEQVRDIVAYAAARHITIVPEIDMPGHASAAIAAYPELGVSDAEHDLPRSVPADWGIYRTLFNVEESTFAFLEAVLDEVLELFPGEYIHIGGDEAVKDQWHASARVQARMRGLGVADEHALQSWFVRRIETYLTSRGRRLIGWDEILEGGLAPNATVMSWRGIDGAVAAAVAGHDAVLSPAPVLYLDNRPLAAAMPGRGVVVSVEDVYRFDPAPAALSEAQRKHILGVQANIWTEHIRTEERVQVMAFPRAAALAEVAWSATEHIDWPSFAARLPAQLARYDALDLRYASQPESTAEARTTRETPRGSHALKLCGDALVLSLEDDAPLREQRAVFLVDIMNPCWIYEDADLSEVTAIATSVGQVPFNFQIGDDVNRIPLRAPASRPGELEVRIDGCDGETIAVAPLAPAAGNFAVTRLPLAAIERRRGVHDLCFTFTRDSVDPIWTIDSVELVRGRGR